MMQLSGLTRIECFAALPPAEGAHSQPFEYLTGEKHNGREEGSGG